ncbi:MAG: ABC transporter substrate-binding protein, partial [Vitreimonas sp.]
MTSRSFTRASFLAALVTASVLAVAPNAHAARNADAEQYVQEHASAALRTLGDRSLSTAQRRQTFDQLMARFADMPRIANFVLGRYGAQLRSDAALRSEWQRTFEEYSVAVYEARLGGLNGSAIRVTDSVERVPGRDIIVTSEILPRTGGRPLPVQWRLL